MLKLWLKETAFMSYELPSKLSEMRTRIGHDHNNRMLLWMGSLIVYGILAAYATTATQIPLWIIGFGGILEIVAIIYIACRPYQQSIELGYVCPLCGGSLWKGSNRYAYDRLLDCGECPHCEQFIADRFE